MDADNEDVILVNECLDGNGRVYEQIVEKYYKVVYRLTAKFVRNTDDAEEITQSVFVKAYENLRSFNPKYKFFSWLYRISVNESINFGKRKKPSDNVPEEMSSLDGNPDNIYENNELSSNIQDALMELDKLSRVPVVLKHFLGYSYKELSYLLGVPEKTVKSRLFTGRQLLKELLIKYKNLI